MLEPYYLVEISGRLLGNIMSQKAAFYTPLALKLDLILDENGSMTRCLLQNEMQRQLMSTSVSNKMCK
jgi:hypothetical protein